MKTPMVTIALAGTSRQEQVNFATGTPVDALLTELPEGEIERTFLLSAGALAVYHQAGVQTQQLDELPPPAGDEVLRECSLEAALLVSRLLSGEQAELLPTALERLRQHGLRLPFRLLPQALNMHGKEIRAALFSVLGTRGRWLSQFNESWKWVNNYLAVDESGLPADAETIWQEGSLGQRAELLRRLRAVDASKGRKWLEAVWLQEKAEARGDFIATLEIGLSVVDEPFLEKALSDRASGVRATAALLLTRLPASALGERMRLRGQGIVQRLASSIEVKIPTTFAEDWLRDGLIEKAPGQISQRGWWLVQILEAIEPTFWEIHLGASPTALLSQLPLDHEWAVQLVEGWSKAALNFRTQHWLPPLWSWWYEHYDEAVKQKSLLEYGYCERLFRHIPGPLAEQLLLKLLQDNHGNPPDSWSDMLSELPRPWGDEFARTYLRFLREFCSVENMQKETFNSYNTPWFNNISIASQALPVACFAEALQPWDFPEETRWQVQHARQQMQAFCETIRTRQKIDEEIV